MREHVTSLCIIVSAKTRLVCTSMCIEKNEIKNQLHILPEKAITQRQIYLDIILFACSIFLLTCILHISVHLFTAKMDVNTISSTKLPSYPLSMCTSCNYRTKTWVICQSMVNMLSQIPEFCKDSHIISQQSWSYYSINKTTVLRTWETLSTY